LKLTYIALPISVFLGIFMPIVVALELVPNTSRRNVSLTLSDTLIGAKNPSEGIFQPNQHDMEKINKSIYVKNPDHKETQIVNGIPYSWYPAVDGVEEGRRIVHPGVIGRQILNSSEHRDEIDALLKGMREIGVSVPNGGIAFYYPKHIEIARLLGPDYHYSSMTAADILSGLAKAAWLEQTAPPDLVDRILDSLTFNYEHGGVNLADKALLELPLFKSAPEIVLNGWLHSLVHLYEVQRVIPEEHETLNARKRIAKILKNNIEFLASIIHQFDAPSVRLSRYSNLSPYTVRIVADDAEIEPVDILYDSRNKGIEDYRVRLKKIDNEERHSLYDNQIIRETPNIGRITATISCSQMFDTYIVREAGPFTVKYEAGRYDYRSTVPATGPHVEKQSTVGSDGLHVVKLGPEDRLTLCGYPTNFSKSGKTNYYHIQHIVALRYLVMAEVGTVSQRCRLEKFASKWDRYVGTTTVPRGMRFAKHQKVLEGLLAGAVGAEFRDWKRLEQAVTDWSGTNCDR
jgi:hypothetical protein